MKYLSNIQIKNYGNHENTNIDLDSNGLYLITGDNGSGKSSIIDAIVWALYGRSIRSKSGWKPYSDKTSVRLKFSDGSAVQKDPKIKVYTDDKVLLQKDALDYIINNFGNFLDFSRSYILHRRLLSRFSTATDNEKRKVLESILGFEALDEAYVRVRDALKIIDYDLGKVRIAISEEERRAASLEGAIGALKGSLEQIYSEEKHSLEAELKALVEPEYVGLPDRRSLGAVEAKNQEWSRIISKLQSEKMKIEKSLENSKCALCGSDSFDVGDMKKCLVEKNVQLEEAQKTGKKLLDLVSEKNTCYEYELKAYNDYKTHRSDFIIKKNNILNRIDSIDRQLVVQHKALSDIDHLSYKLNSYMSELSILEHKYAMLTSKKERLEYYKKMYGNKGLRITLLRDTLNIISKHIFNIYNGVFRNHPEHSDNVRPVVVEDGGAIKIGVQKLGTFIPYSGMSEGEKGIMDLAIIKGLYHLSPKRVNFPVVYDDVFDTFDNHVTEALLKFVCVEASKRPVFIITHDINLLEKINKYSNNITHYSVKDGCIYGS